MVKLLQIWVLLQLFDDKDVLLVSSEVPLQLVTFPFRVECLGKESPMHHYPSCSIRWTQGNTHIKGGHNPSAKIQKCFLISVKRGCSCLSFNTSIPSPLFWANPVALSPISSPCCTWVFLHEQGFFGSSPLCTSCEGSPPQETKASLTSHRAAARWGVFAHVRLLTQHHTWPAEIWRFVAHCMKTTISQYEELLKVSWPVGSLIN